MGPWCNPLEMEHPLLVRDHVGAVFKVDPDPFQAGPVAPDLRVVCGRLGNALFGRRRRRLLRLLVVVFGWCDGRLVGHAITLF